MKNNADDDGGGSLNLRTHCPQRELTGYLRFKLSHCVQSLILQFLSQMLLAHHRDCAERPNSY
jgi:hypothetical protein